MNINLPTDRPFFILGPCVIESEAMVVDMARRLADIGQALSVPIIFKASYDKANRTSGQSFRGVGLEKGLAILSKAREVSGLPIITDVHTPEEARAVASTVDFLQTPAMLCRQTDLIEAAAATGKPVNIKKGQFLSPHEMKNVAQKALDAGAKKEDVFLCERGFSFGYNNLVVDMRSLNIMRAMGHRVVFDATHSVQLPGGGGDKSSGQREFVPVLARAAMAVGIDGVFMETHPNPDKALSDGPNAWPLNKMENLLKQLIAMDKVARENPL